MLKIVTVCGNGIGSSLLLKMKLEEIASENNLQVEVESIDSNAAIGKGADLYVTVKEFKSLFSDEHKVAYVRSFTNKKKIMEDILPTLQELAK